MEGIRPHTPMTYTQVLSYLIKKGLLEIKSLAPPPTPLRGYNGNARCEFHDGSPRHITEKCLALKFKVQYLLDQNHLFHS